MESQVLKCCFTPLNDQDDCGQKWQVKAKDSIFFFFFSFENYLKEMHSTTTGQGTHMQIHTYATDEKNFLLDLVTIITKVIYMTQPWDYLPLKVFKSEFWIGFK